MQKLRRSRSGNIYDIQGVLGSVAECERMLGLEPALRNMQPIKKSKNIYFIKDIGNNSREAYSVKISSDFIVVKNNIISLYDDFAIKIFEDNKHLARHCQGIAKFNETGPAVLRPPEVIRLEKGSPFFVVERRVFGKTPESGVNFVSALIQDMVKFHTYKVEFKKFSDDSRILENFKRGMRISILPRKLKDEVAEFFNIINDNDLVPFGYCHGDLSKSNILKGNDALYIMDWEKFKFGRIFRDISKIVFQFDGNFSRSFLNEYGEKSHIFSNEEIRNLKFINKPYDISEYMIYVEKILEMGEMYSATDTRAIQNKKGSRLLRAYTRARLILRYNRQISRLHAMRGP